MPYKQKTSRRIAFFAAMLAILARAADRQPGHPSRTSETLQPRCHRTGLIEPNPNVRPCPESPCTPEARR